MNEDAHRLFHSFIQFRKLHFSSIITEMNHSEFSILKGIAYKKISTSDLAKKLRVSSPSISRSLKGLEKKNYITREISPSDRRNTFILLTDQGKEKLFKAEETMKDFTDHVVAQMDKDHLEKLIQYMQDFFNISQKELDKRKEEIERKHADE